MRQWRLAAGADPPRVWPRALPTTQVAFALRGRAVLEAQPSRLAVSDALSGETHAVIEDVRPGRVTFALSPDGRRVGYGVQKDGEVWWMVKTLP